MGLGLVARRDPLSTDRPSWAMGSCRREASPLRAKHDVNVSLVDVPTTVIGIVPPDRRSLVNVSAFSALSFYLVILGAPYHAKNGKNCVWLGHSRCASMSHREMLLQVLGPRGDGCGHACRALDRGRLVGEPVGG